jgi:hypothetical protein
MMVSREIRRLIREMLLIEAMYTPETAAASGLIFRVVKTKWGRGGWTVICEKKGEYWPLGEVSIALPLGMGKCLGAYEVTGSESSSLFDGLGPLLYDIAMEMAGPAGLMSDRRSVSSSARRVWDFYLKSRSDVTNRQLDSKPGTITPDVEEDDCVQISAATTRVFDAAGGWDFPERGGGWQNSALSKVYRKRGTPTIDRLRELGIIEVFGG